MGATAFDVAAYILVSGPQQSLALQKLLYYAQGWCLVETGRPCFDDTIEAWRNGPVVRRVWGQNAGARQVESVAGDPDNVPEEHRTVLDDILATYGAVDARDLVDLTHAEPGWLRARQGLEPEQKGDRGIDSGEMVRFLAGQPGSTLRERMTTAIAKAQARADLRAVMAPHRETLKRLAQ